MFIDIGSKELAEIVLEALTYAKRLLLKDGGLIPTAFIFPMSGDVALMAMPFSTSYEKNLFHLALKNMVQKIEAIAVIYISEAWFTKIKDQSLIAKLAVEGVESHPDSEEALIVVGVTKDNLSFKAGQTFKRKEGQFIFGELETTSIPPIHDTIVDNLWGEGMLH